MRKLMQNSRSRKPSSARSTSQSTRSSAQSSIGGRNGARSSTRSSMRGSSGNTTARASVKNKSKAKSSTKPRASYKAPSPRSNKQTSNKPSKAYSKNQKAQTSPFLQGAYNQPSLWTKGEKARSGAQNQKAKQKKGLITSIFSAIAACFMFLFRALAHLFAALGGLLAKSRALTICVILTAILGVGVLADVAINGNRIYAGVHVGNVDVSGMTTEEAASALIARYQQNIDNNEVIVFADEALYNQVSAATQTSAAATQTNAAAQASTLSEDLSISEKISTGSAWVATAQTLSASLDASALAREAFCVGRENGGILTRLQALFSSWTCDIRLDFSQDTLENFAEQLDESTGNPCVDFDIEINEGTASLIQGHDGYLASRSELAQKIESGLLASESSCALVEPVMSQVRINEASAQRTCDSLNAILQTSATFTLDNYTWEEDGATIGSWISASAQETTSGWQLIPVIDKNKAKSPFLAKAIKTMRASMPNINFTKNNELIEVQPAADAYIPNADDAVGKLDVALLDNVRASLCAGEAYISSEQTSVNITTTSTKTNASLSFSDAFECGLIEEISSYTTQYKNSESSANRVHNIHLAADKLTNSIVSANGGTWSFYDIAGECNEDAGFLGAGTIIDGEHDDAIGGGVCQVATTVFNAVYESGFPVVRRYNHTLYMSNYPDGRDAAVSYPDLDLVWKNDSSSDVLVCCTYTDTSLTVTLYGVSPNYSVSTKTGEWQEGEAYRTRLECDESMAKGSSYIKTAGVNGSSITIWRTVKDSSGNILHEDEFDSKYDPETEVIVAGPGTTITVGTEELTATAGQSVTSKKTSS